MLKATAVSVAAPVTKLFNLSISSGTFPTKWKLSSVVHIPKSSDKGSPKNYRPISLLPILREKHGLLSKHLQLSEPIYDSQFGFQRGKSTTTALLETTHNSLQLLESGRDIGAIFFDFKKAFDSVPHRALIDKLKGINLNPLLLHWIQSYLSGRSQEVLVNGEKSDPCQGSVIGPLLFLIYIDGIKTTPLSGESHLTLYADNMLLYRPITSIADFALLQQDIDSISDWVDKNYLQFNVQKCKFMHITRKTKCSQPASHLTLYGQPLERVNTYVQISWSVAIK